MDDTDDIPIKQITYPNDYVVVDDVRISTNEYPIETKINFNEASIAWRTNKVKSKKNHWRYGCIHKRANNRLCKKPLAHPFTKWCKYHFKLYRTIDL